MSKVAFVFDKPKTCEECPVFDYCFDNLCSENAWEYDCPLVPIRMV